MMTNKYTVNGHNYLCIDIESIPQQNQSEWMEEYVENKLKNKRGENKDANKYKSLNPEFGEVFCICLYNSVDAHMHIFYEETEEETLQQFWDYLKDNIDEHRFVGFNSKSFDIPFIKKRSSIKAVNTFNIDIPARKYYNNEHYDILEVLSNFGQNDMHSLDFYCKLYGITKDNGTDGSDVYTLYLNKDYEKIIDKCCEDAAATRDLYLRVKDYL